MWAVERDVSGTMSFNTTAPTGTDITNWNLGWTQPAGQSGVTGWNYVGTVGGASGVYLGNNWVLTAGHVGAATFTLAGASYSVVPGSTQTISDSNGQADICLFQVSPAPNLPALPIATSGPSDGTSVAILGYGGGGGNETWGLNAVTDNGILVNVESFFTTDFQTAYGTSGNTYFLVSGDSGGGDFAFNSATQQWELVGINEAIDTSKNPPDSYFVELSAYASQINAITAQPVPALPWWGWGVLFASIPMLVSRYLPRKVSR